MSLYCSLSICIDPGPSQNALTLSFGQVVKKTWWKISTECNGSRHLSFSRNLLLIHLLLFPASEATPAPRFLSRGQTYRAVIGDTLALPCEVDNLGEYKHKKKKCLFLDLGIPEANYLIKKKKKKIWECKTWFFEFNYYYFFFIKIKRLVIRLDLLIANGFLKTQGETKRFFF